MYKNSLILRTCMTEEPFVHKKAFSDVITNFEYHKKIGKILFKLIEEKGIINLAENHNLSINLQRKKF